MTQETKYKYKTLTGASELKKKEKVDIPNTFEEHERHVSLKNMEENNRLFVFKIRSNRCYCKIAV